MFTLNVTDNAGATDTDTLTVTVTAETQPPVISCPTQPVTANTAPGMCKANVSFTVTATDNCDKSVSINCQPPSGSEFLKGTTTVNCTATDDNTNMSLCSFSVIVTDNEKPQITCPPNKTQGNDLNECGAVVTYPNATASDNCPGVGTPSCSPSSGSFFPVGTTTVTCNVSDQSGNTNSCSFTVTVNDTQAPGLTCPADKIAVAGNACPVATSAIVNYTAPPATDNCAGATATCLPPPGSSFPVGTTTVTCKATDAQGNMTTCTFKVTVFNICLLDDANPNARLMINSFTGQYRFQCGVIVFAGFGKISNTPGSCLFALNHMPPDRRVRANWATTTMSGNASLQAPVGVERCTILDRDMTNNNCNAP